MSNNAVAAQLIDDSDVFAIIVNNYHSLSIGSLSLIYQFRYISDLLNKKDHADLSSQACWFACIEALRNSASKISFKFYTVKSQLGSWADFTFHRLLLILLKSRPA